MTAIGLGLGRDAILKLSVCALLVAAPVLASPARGERRTSIAGQDICTVFDHNPDGSWTSRVRLKVKRGSETDILPSNMTVTAGTKAFAGLDLAATLDRECHLY